MGLIQQVPLPVESGFGYGGFRRINAMGSAQSAQGHSRVHGSNDCKSSMFIGVLEG